MSVVPRTTWRSALVCAACPTTQVTRKNSTHSAVSEGTHRWSKPLLSAVLFVPIVYVCVCVFFWKRSFLYEPRQLSVFPPLKTNTSMWVCDESRPVLKHISIYISNTRQKMMIDYSLTAGVCWCQTNGRCAVVCSYQRWFSKVHCRVSVCGNNRASSSCFLFLIKNTHKKKISWKQKK